MTVDTEPGICGWYARRDGTPTASGEPFNSTQLTAAHKWLPLGSKVLAQVGFRHLVVRINDRPPVDTNLVLQVTPGARDLLGLEWVNQMNCVVDFSKACCDAH